MGGSLCGLDQHGDWLAQEARTQPQFILSGQPEALDGQVRCQAEIRKPGAHGHGDLKIAQLQCRKIAALAHGDLPPAFSTENTVGASASEGEKGVSPASRQTRHTGVDMGSAMALAVHLRWVSSGRCRSYGHHFSTTMNDFDVRPATGCFSQGPLTAAPGMIATAMIAVIRPDQDVTCRSPGNQRALGGLRPLPATIWRSRKGGQGRRRAALFSVSGCRKQGPDRMGGRRFLC